MIRWEDMRPLAGMFPFRRHDRMGWTAGRQGGGGPGGKMPSPPHLPSFAFRVWLQPSLRTLPTAPDSTSHRAQAHAQPARRLAQRYKGIKSSAGLPLLNPEQRLHQADERKSTSLKDWSGFHLASIITPVSLHKYLFAVEYAPMATYANAPGTCTWYKYAK